MKSLPLLITLLAGHLAFNDSIAQNVNGKLSELNVALGDAYTISNKGNTLIVAGFREGKQLKEERINVFDLDVKTIRYNESDNAVIVNCFSDTDGCVEQKLLLDRKKDYRKRLVFGLEGIADHTRVENLLRELLTEMCKTH